MKLAIAQFNPIIADIEGNRSSIISKIRAAEKAGADLLIFPEMATIGYPPMDLIENRKLIDDNLRSLELIAAETTDIAVVCGFVDYDPENPPMLQNSAAFMNKGKVLSTHPKTLLPTYDVFDELRYFTPSKSQEPVEFMNMRLGITICEDIWNVLHVHENRYTEHRRYNIDPVEELSRAGIDMLINISASPYVRGKNKAKREMLSDIASAHGISLVYANQVGGNDSLIFDGNSLVFNNTGALIAQAAGFREDMIITDTSGPQVTPESASDIEDIHRALVLGVHDYVHKCGFKKAVIGLSGGIDSALTAALAVQALGAENVTGITMPSMYSSRGSIDDSVQLARNLGICINEVPIADIYYRYLADLEPLFRKMPEDVTEENIQARIRGNILMAFSNKTGSLLLTTGNKSELAMGYCTLYGDMSGGLAVISDLPKTLVYELARHINRDTEIIPLATIEKPPSAELRPGQKDEDSLPPYETLDRILELYIEEKLSAEEIISEGFPGPLVRDILNSVNRNEYKRIQAAPGLKVTTKAFGIGRRIPIAQKFRP